tara:strand:- start:219 stop:404 length:186 start_codon:yes stop_codon:yes gene_type:complete
MYTLAKELNIPPHELGNYPASLVSDLMLIFAEIKEFEAESMDKVTKNAKKGMGSTDGVNFG